MATAHVYESMPADARRVVVCMNPRAGAGNQRRKVERLTEALSARRFEVRVETDLATATGIAHDWLAEGKLRALIGAGGDGTLSELANRTSPGVPLCPLPLGTENLVAKYLGLFGSINAVANAVTLGRGVRFDAGGLNGRLFLAMVSCGFDAEIIHRIAQARKGHITHLSYLKPIWDAVRKYGYPPIRVRWPKDSPAAGNAGSTGQATAAWVFAFNLPCYALRLGVGRAADGRDGLLDLRLFARGSFLGGIRYFLSAMTGNVERLADVTSLTAASFLLESDVPVPVQVDGDVAGTLPATVEVLPGRVCLLAGNRWFRKHAIPVDSPQEAVACP